MQSFDFGSGYRAKQSLYHTRQLVFLGHLTKSLSQWASGAEVSPRLWAPSLGKSSRCSRRQDLSTSCQLCSQTSSEVFNSNLFMIHIRVFKSRVGNNDIWIQFQLRNEPLESLLFLQVKKKKKYVRSHDCFLYNQLSKSGCWLKGILIKIQDVATQKFSAVVQYFHTGEEMDPSNCSALSNGKLANTGQGQAAKPTTNAQSGINQHSESGFTLPF